MVVCVKGDSGGKNGPYTQMGGKANISIQVAVQRSGGRWSGIHCGCQFAVTNWPGARAFVLHNIRTPQ